MREREFLIYKVFGKSFCKIEKFCIIYQKINKKFYKHIKNYFLSYSR